MPPFKTVLGHLYYLLLQPGDFLIKLGLAIFLTNFLTLFGRKCRQIFACRLGQSRCFQHFFRFAAGQIVVGSLDQGREILAKMERGQVVAHHFIAADRHLALEIFAIDIAKNHYLEAGADLAGLFADNSTGVLFALFEPGGLDYGGDALRGGGGQVHGNSRFVDAAIYYHGMKARQIDRLA